MKLIIEIPDEAYNELIKEQHLPSGLDVEYLIIHGTPLEFGNISVEAIEESSHCPACIHYVQRDIPNVICNSCKNRDELYRRINNDNL